MALLPGGTAQRSIRAWGFQSFFLTGTDGSLNSGGMASARLAGKST